MSPILFWLSTVWTLGFALALVLTRNPLRGALYLILCLCGVACFFLLLGGPFVGVMQILVYAGAIMVLFVFVIMLLNLKDKAERRRIKPSMLLGLAGLGALLMIVFSLVWGIESPSTHAFVSGAHIGGIGKLLLTKFLFHFEAISLLLVVAIVGAVMLGMHRDEVKLDDASSQ